MITRVQMQALPTFPSKPKPAAQSLRIDEISFKCLEGKSIFEAKISDHLPVIHEGMLFWNIMMQCRYNAAGNYFNNGFGLVESDSQYEKRLFKISQLVAELVDNWGCIDRIGFCEGPIGEKADLFFGFLKSHLFLSTFPSNRGQFSLVNLNSKAPDWGVLFLAHKKYSVKNDSIEPLSLTEFPKLENRFRVFKLTLSNSDEAKYVALAHFPLGSDDQVIQHQNLSASSHRYRSFINEFIDGYSEKDLTMSCDFNFNPHLIDDMASARYGDRIPSHNNIKFISQTEQSLTTVDGILLSRLSKQKVHQDKVQWPLVQTEKKPNDKKGG